MISAVVKGSSEIIIDGTCDKIEKIFLFFIQLLNRLIRIHISRSLYTNYVSILSKYFIADRVLIFSLLIFGPMHLDEFAGLQLSTCDGTSIELFDEGHYIDQIEDVPFYGAYWVLK